VALKLSATVLRLMY